VALAVLTHVVAGGHAPNAVLVAVAWALGAVVALPFTNRRPGTTRLMGLLLPAQLIYHLAFGGHVGAHHTAAHLHGADLTVALGTTPHSAGDTPFMFAAHVLAALGSVAAIRYAERGFDAARALAHELSDVVVRLARAARLPRIPATRRRAWSCSAADPALLRDLLLPRALTRRGPPTFLAAHA
jgi:hypothetical protein